MQTPWSQTSKNFITTKEKCSAVKFIFFRRQFTDMLHEVPNSVKNVLASLERFSSALITPLYLQMLSEDRRWIDWKRKMKKGTLWWGSI